MPIADVFHERNALALDSVPDYAFGFAVISGLPNLVEREENLFHIVAVNFVSLKTKRPKFPNQITERHNFICRAVDLQVVIVDEGD